MTLSILIYTLFRGLKISTTVEQCEAFNAATEEFVSLVAMIYFGFWTYTFYKTYCKVQSIEELERLAPKIKQKFGEKDFIFSTWNSKKQYLVRVAFCALVILMEAFSNYIVKKVHCPYLKEME